MSWSSPVPPPPPPVLPSSSSTPRKLTRQSTYVKQICDQEDVRKSFHERLEKNVLKRDGKKIVISMNKEVTPVLQDGPSCGLVAVVMAAQLFDTNFTFHSIFDAAKQKGFTRQGEMFSASNMKQLVEDMIPDARVTSLDMDTGPELLINHLVKGDVCLIPYDSDFNFEPCNKKGHKAHWALLTGFGLVLDSSVSDQKGLTVDDSCVVNVASDTILSNTLLDDAEDILVYGLQGKSQYPGVWSLSSIIASNRNLVEVGPNKQDDDIGYILPEEGIEKALCSKALVLSRGNLNQQ
ncbi:actin maturation protease-like [Mytilus trossulus]|uniref:actin maturation protease-like n=1 Tax=Mytilus trossulus TaxID=6551 RepID=UPI003004AD8C